MKKKLKMILALFMLTSSGLIAWQIYVIVEHKHQIDADRTQDEAQQTIVIIKQELAYNLSVAHYLYANSDDEAKRASLKEVINEVELQLANNALSVNQWKMLLSKLKDAIETFMN